MSSNLFLKIYIKFFSENHFKLLQIFEEFEKIFNFYYFNKFL